MNKYQVYKEIREELGADFEKEFKDLQELLTKGVSVIGNAHATLQLVDPKSLAAFGEARKILTEEIEESLRLILERYERNLKKEVGSLGLVLPRASRTNGAAAYAEPDSLAGLADLPGEAAE